MINNRQLVASLLATRAVFINRPGKDDIDIYFTGTKDGCVHFNGLMQASLLNPTPNKN